MVLKANDRRTSSPCHDEFRRPRSDYVRQAALETTTTTQIGPVILVIIYFNRAEPYNSSFNLLQWKMVHRRVKPEKRPVWYLFNCTANEFPSMIKSLMEIKVFANSIKKSAEALKHYGFNLIDLMTNQDKTGTNLRNITSVYSLTVATQIALIDILKAVGIVPSGVIGYGVEELLCGYADGSLTAEQVILAAYWTARTLEESKLEDGTMVDLATIRKRVLYKPAQIRRFINVTITRRLWEDFGKQNMPGKRARKHFSQLSEFERGLIIGMKTAGWSTCRVAGQVDRSECAIRNCWEQWIREGTHARKTGSGATRKITRRKDRRIVRQAFVDPTVTRSTIREDVGVAIIPQIISKHLAEANLKM
ncbi:fatty acid synthase [Trichonephila clavipes]|nr:fatty acid synthase [Trichonephila clavipes]